MRRGLLGREAIGRGEGRVYGARRRCHGRALAQGYRGRYGDDLDELPASWPEDQNGTPKRQAKRGEISKRKGDCTKEKRLRKRGRISR